MPSRSLLPPGPPYNTPHEQRFRDPLTPYTVSRVLRVPPTHRFKRDTDFISTNPYDGGPSYNDQVCVNNWTEEQHDRNYKTGFHPKPLRKGGRFSTEYMQRYSPTSEEYRQRLKDTYNTTQVRLGVFLN